MREIGKLLVEFNYWNVHNPRQNIFLSKHEKVDTIDAWGTCSMTLFFPDGRLSPSKATCPTHDCQIAFECGKAPNGKFSSHDTLTIYEMKLGGKRVQVFDNPGYAFGSPKNAVMLRQTKELLGRDYRLLERYKHYLNQNPIWGPGLMSINQKRQIEEAWVHSDSLTSHPVDSDWYTPDGRWVNSEYQYLAMEKVNG